jgi:hypothetical protein
LRVTLAGSGSIGGAPTSKVTIKGAWRLIVGAFATLIRLSNRLEAEFNSFVIYLCQGNSSRRVKGSAAISLGVQSLGIIRFLFD